jgi:hypothetical protein
VAALALGLMLAFLKRLFSELQTAFQMLCRCKVGFELVQLAVVGLFGSGELRLATFKFCESLGLRGSFAGELRLLLVELRLLFLKLLLPLIEQRLPLLQRGGLGLDLAGRLAVRFLLPRDFLTDLVELAGDASFQLAQAIALAANPLANAASLLVDRVRQGLAPRIGWRRFA